MNVQEYYNQYWSDSGFYPHGQITPKIADLFQTYLQPGARCLDVGCGDGRAAGVWLTNKGVQYTGVDISHNAIKDAKALGLNAIQIDDVTRLPFPDNSFDAVVCFEVLEHLFNPLLAVQEMIRVMRPGAVLLCTVPNLAYWRRRVDMMLLGRWNPLGDDLSVEQPWRDPHIRFFNPGVLRRMLRRAELEHITVGGHAGTFWGDMPWIGRRMGDRYGPTPYRRLERSMPALFAYRLHAIAFKPG